MMALYMPGNNMPGHRCASWAALARTTPLVCPAACMDAYQARLRSRASAIPACSWVSDIVDKEKDSADKDFMMDQ